MLKLTCTHVADGGLGRSIGRTYVHENIDALLGMLRDDGFEIGDRWGLWDNTDSVIASGGDYVLVGEIRVGNELADLGMAKPYPNDNIGGTLYRALWRYRYGFTQTMAMGVEL